MNAQEASSLAKWAKRESLKLAQEWPKGSQRETELLATWKLRRPKMLALLRQHGAAEALAHVLVDRAVKMEIDLMRQGMPSPDATEQAEREWLLTEPEDETDLNPRLSALTTSSATLSP